MRNLIKRISALLLCLLLVLSLPVTALAEEAKDTDEAAAAEEGTTLRILRQKQFLDFTENCRLDSYSRNLSVVLLTDIDLTGVDFAGIPIFCGNGPGNMGTMGHRSHFATIANKVITIDIVYIAIPIIVRIFRTIQFRLIHPHIVYQIRMVKLYSLINNCDNHITGSCFILPGFP